MLLVSVACCTVPANAATGWLIATFFCFLCTNCVPLIDAGRPMRGLMGNAALCCGLCRRM